MAGGGGKRVKGASMQPREMREIAVPDHATSTAAVTGVVTAGGRSRRFGRDKATAMLAGTTMAVRVAKALEPVTDQVILVTNYPDRHGGLGIPVHQDLVPNRGPVGALHTALHVVSTPWCLVVGCDYPLVTSRVLASIWAVARDSSADAVVPRIDGRPQPMVAAYRRSCAPILERRVVDGRLKMVELFSVLQVDWLTVSDFHPIGDIRRSFLNVNTPEDLERAASLLRLGTRPRV